MLQTRTDEVLKADSWCDVDMSFIITLLQQDTLNVESELTLLSACQRWAQHQLGINRQQDDDTSQQDDDTSQQDDDTSQQHDDTSQQHDDTSKQGDTCRHDDTSQHDDFNQDVKLRQILSPLLPYLRILTLTYKQFLQATKTCPIFSKMEELLILKCLHEPKESKLPDGMCQISNARDKPDTDQCKTIVVEIKEYLETLPMITTDFTSRDYCFSPSTEVRITIYKDIVVYGFSYKTLEFSCQDPVHQARLYNKVREYDEDLTVQFINTRTERCVAEYKYKGKLQYDTDVNVEFPQPFHAQESVPHSLKFEFHHQHTDRKYEFFFKDIKRIDWRIDPDNYEIMNSNEFALNFPCISQLLYKVI